MTDRIVTAEQAQVLVEDTAPEHRMTGIHAQVFVEDSAPDHRITSVVVQVLAPEYWYGWGINLEGGDE